MNKLLATVALLGVIAGTTPADAYCTGFGAFRQCSDSSGNSYSIRRFGNSTYMNGYNAQTGNSWSQTSRTFGNTTLHNGFAGNGNSWNMTSRRLGNTTLHNGLDSRGNFFSYTCTKWGGCN